MTLFGKIIFGGVGISMCMAIFYGTRMYVNQDQGQAVTQKNITQTNPLVTEEATTSIDMNLQRGSTTAKSTDATTQEKSKATSTKSTTQKASTSLSTSSEATSTRR